MNWPCPHPSVFSVLMVYEHHDVVLQLVGELDIAGRSALDECIATALAERPRRLVFELSALEFVDVYGAHAFRHARSEASDAGVEVILDNPNPTVCQLLDWCGVLDGATVR
jgi:anti-anti-sigma factor